MVRKRRFPTKGCGGAREEEWKRDILVGRARGHGGWTNCAGSWSGALVAIARQILAARAEGRAAAERTRKRAIKAPLAAAYGAEVEALIAKKIEEPPFWISRRSGRNLFEGAASGRE